MSKTITISDETYEAIKDQIEKTEGSELLAAISLMGDCPRLILNLPDMILSDRYKGETISINMDGCVCNSKEKKRYKINPFYGDEKQVFPIK